MNGKQNSNEYRIRQKAAKIINQFILPALTFLFLTISAHAQQDQTAALVVPVKENAPTNLSVSRPNALDDDKIVNWMLRDAIAAALENNVDIAIERKNVRLAELNLTAAQGVYDGFLTASPSFTTSHQPNIGRFSGLGTTLETNNVNIRQ